MLWTCGSFSFDLSAPVLMGILNVTPDSFSDGGQHNVPADAVAFARKLLADGAQIIDVGGESTRPGSAEVSVEEELERVVPVVRELAEAGVAVSVDTRHAQVARASLEAGACIINDVAGMRDAAMRDVVAGSDCGVVIMHMLGEPGTMQADPVYDDVVEEVEEYLLDAARELERRGVARERICLDPGVGFGKTAAHNRALLEATPDFAALGYPYMVAVSRKSYIGACTGIEAPAQRDAASALCAAAALRAGAQVARVHDVAGTVAALERSRRAVVALGSNVGPGEAGAAAMAAGADGAGAAAVKDGAGAAAGDGRVAQLDAAIDALLKVPGIWVADVSSYYESEPAYYDDQPAFANAVALLQTTLAPRELLDALHGIEDAQGRTRSVENGPRTLDLDILDYEGVTSDDAKLALPHPRVLEREFTVMPLLELLPQAVLADGRPVKPDAAVHGKIYKVLRQR